MTTRRKRTKYGQAQGARASGPVDAAGGAAPEGAEGPTSRERAGPGDREQVAHFRLEQLYAISKLLTRFDSAEKTVPAVIAVMAETLPLRSAIFIMERENRPLAIVSQLDGERAHPLQEAKTRATRSYAYLAGSAAARLSFLNDQDAANDSSAGQAHEPVDRRNFVMLPLAIEHRPIFGALQLESLGAMDEKDLVFVNAAVNQLAIALDRHVSMEAKQAAAEAKWVMAEGRQIVAQAARARAEHMEAAARTEQAEAERKRDIARAEHQAEELRRGAAEALRERYEALVDNIDHAFVWEADARTGRVSYLSARAELLLGHPRERWLGNADFWTSCVHPDDQKLITETFRRALTEKKDQRCDHRCLTVASASTQNASCGKRPSVSAFWPNRCRRRSPPPNPAATSTRRTSNGWSLRGCRSRSSRNRAGSSSSTPRIGTKP